MLCVMNICFIKFHRKIWCMPYILGLPWWLSDKESACNARESVSILELGRSPWGGHRQPTPVFLLENPHGQRKLADKTVEHNRVTEHACTHTSWPGNYIYVISFFFFKHFPFLYFSFIYRWLVLIQNNNIHSGVWEI